MARIYREPGEKVWVIDFTDATGKRRRLKTTTESKRAAEDLLAEKTASKVRQKLGLEVVPTSKVRTLGEAWEMWLKSWCPPGSTKREWRRYKANGQSAWLCSMDLTEIDGAMLDRWFKEKSQTQAPRTVNGHRRIIRCVFYALIRRRLFRGVNPVRETDPIEEPEYAYETLTEAEFDRVLPHLPSDWRDIFEVAFCTGLRRGEIYALRKDRRVVDVERATLTPRASNGRELPKGKRVKSIPLTERALAVFRRVWMKIEPGDLLFPSADGELRSEYLRPADILRSALAKAGFIEGWLHVCRKGCGKDQRHPAEQQRKCGVCGRIMWPKPIVRKVRFHDLRHSTASHLLDRGVDLADVSQMLRHSSIDITNRIYRHRTVDALRGAIERPSPLALERKLAQLEEGQPQEIVDVLRESRKKLAETGHSIGNVTLLNQKKAQ